jgi:hypothetical protein
LRKAFSIQISSFPAFSIITSSINTINICPFHIITINCHLEKHYYRININVNLLIILTC